MTYRLGLVVPLLSLLIGCSRTSVTPAPQNADSSKSPPIQAVKKPTSPPPTKSDPPLTKIPAKKENPEIIKNKDSGIIHGVIRWEGAEPSPPTPRLRIDSATHGVGQTAVWLISNKRTTPASTEPVHLVVEQGEYRPHIVLAQKGSSIELGTIDERADFQASGAATFSETIKRGNKRRFSLASLGLIEVRSQLQPKRTPAYIWVLDGSLGTISGTEGRFRLPPVPPGDYELVLWHEDWHTGESLAPRRVQVKIALGPNEGAEVRWTLTER